MDPNNFPKTAKQRNSVCSHLDFTQCSEKKMYTDDIRALRKHAYQKQHTRATAYVHSKMFPSEKKIYTDYIRESVTNSMSVCQ